MECNINNIHWILIAMGMQQEKFLFYDSFNGTHNHVIMNIKELYLASSTHTATKCQCLSKNLPYYLNAINCQNWPYTRITYPHQWKGFNCGIFMYCFAKCLMAKINAETVNANNINFW